MICEYCATELNAVRDEESACSPRGPYMRPEEHTPERCRDVLKAKLDEAHARGLAPAKTYRARAEAAEKLLAVQEKLAEDFHTAAIGAETRAAHFQKTLEHIRDQSYAGLTADYAERALKIFDVASWAGEQLRDPKVADAVLGEGAAWRARAERFRMALVDVQHDLLGHRDGLEGRLIVGSVLARIVRALTDSEPDDLRAERLSDVLGELRDELNEHAKHESDKTTDFSRGAAFAFREAVHAVNAAIDDSAPDAARRGADSCILDPGERSDDEPQPWNVPPDKELSMKTTSELRRELRARADDMDDRFYGTEVDDLLDDLDAALSALTSARAAAAIDWDDADDGWSKEIEAAHPMRTGAHNRYAVAMMMVGHRHSKGQLVALVCWLLGRAEEAERGRDRLWALVEESVRVVDTFHANIQGQTSSEIVDPISYGIATQYISKARAALGRAPAAPTSHLSVAKALSDLLDFIFDGASYPLAYGGRFRILACDARDALRAARGEAADDDGDRGSP